VPAHPDSVSIESEAAPLLVPGRSETPDSLVRTPRKFATAQYGLGVAMEQAGNLSAAMISYTNSVRADSTLPGASGRLGHLYLQLGRPAQAEPLLRRELRLDPRGTGASRDLGVALSALGRHAEAIARLKRLTTSEPANDENWYSLGVAYASAGRVREAEAPLRRSIALSPDRPLEHRDLGVVLASLNRPREAREEYARALALDPADGSVWLNIGNVEARAGRADSAFAAYREAERRDSTDALAYEGELKMLTQRNRRDDIADLYMRWVTARPQDDDLRLGAVRSLAALDRRDRALEIGRDGVRYDAHSPAKRLILGLSLAAYGSTREALEQLRAADSMFTRPRDRDRVRQLVASMRQSAPDSLREMFRADSVAHAGPREPAPAPTPKGLPGSR
jgi:tetratricopeptide (TPR) repeat protein